MFGIVCFFKDTWRTDAQVCEPNETSHSKNEVHTFLDKCFRKKIMRKKMLARQILAEIFGAEKKKVGERFVSKKCRGRERSIARIFGQFGARGVAARRGATRRNRAGDRGTSCAKNLPIFRGPRTSKLHRDRAPRPVQCKARRARQNDVF